MPATRHGTHPTRSAPGFHGQLAEVDLRLLRVFRTVATRGGFTAAEMALGKSKSSISIDISSLENRLRIRLCRRGRGGFALTPEGRQVLEATEDLLRDIDRFRDRVNVAGGVLSGRFTLYVIDNLLAYGETGIVRALELFARRHPAIFIDMVSAPVADIEQALLDGRATAALTLMPRAQPALSATGLVSETLHLYCGRRHPFFDRGDAPLTPAMLEDQRLIDVSDAATAPGWPALRRRLSFAASAGTIDSRAMLIMTGIYLGFLPDAFAAPLVRDGHVRRLACDGLPPLVTRLHFVVKKDAGTSLMTDTFRTILDSTC
ncbi:LysR family transcriptional regulator [Gluconacetobacter johannae DSM 13595]|uniref:LysR family transcriptional regulator n=1 Tax=Gluconacetobacter johannae TaxID=112140 RepID=A0A7W4J7M7_9PROT|nr:LysR family transcriptional regulator [Gluconacetobacter johannae]MBB2176206.1 LysR family transcriptional regulator [Gluconacetobacter johannae]GBQ89166.1 LysR family transcriptional regulator [Gluconacetobacter johannae DSM 13595]